MGCVYEEACRQWEGTPVEPEYTDSFERTRKAAPNVAAGYSVETSLIIFGLMVRGVLLDTGAQLCLISIGSLFSLAHLHKGTGFYKALRSALWNTPEVGRRTISGIGGATLRILGYVNLVITAGNKDIEIPFAITKEGNDRMIIGSPGLRALGFSLRSPLYKGIDFLRSPREKEDEAGLMRRQEAMRNTSPEDSPSEAPKLDATPEDNAVQKKPAALKTPAAQK
ncbi:hypothetical protein KC887_09770, partial [Candidatus Kaiserbacteria bacterium]|nr:hypothetical protein [Candidatus Kaiserbacteria bacterium]